MRACRMVRGSEAPLSTEPTTALVTTGPYAVSRNPAMLLIWCFHLACALTLNSLWLLPVAWSIFYSVLKPSWPWLTQRLARFHWVRWT